MFKIFMMFSLSVTENTIIHFKTYLCVASLEQGAREGTHKVFAKKNKVFARNKNLVIGGDGGIRTHVPFRATRFRVELVMTASIRLRISSGCLHIFRIFSYLPEYPQGYFR